MSREVELKRYWHEQGRWSLEPRRLFHCQQQLPFLHSLSLFSFFFFFGMYVCTLKICFIANASRKVTILSTIQATCIRVGHWSFKPGYSFNQTHMNNQPASRFSGLSKASLWRHLFSHINQSNRSRMPVLDGDIPPEFAFFRIKTELKFLSINCIHVFCLSFHYNKNNLTFRFPMHVTHDG